jgi:hypothetical protein
MEKPAYSNDLLDEKFKSVHAKMESNKGILIEHLERIEAQTIKTNGRVSELEVSVGSLNNWRYFITGGLAVITAMVIPLIIYIFVSASA